MLKKTSILILAFLIFQNSSLAAENYGDKKMEITVNIYYTGTDGSARKFAQEMEQSGIAEAIRQKNGNLKYEYFYPVHNEETVLLIDSWENQAALDEHHASDLMPKIMELRNKYDLHMKVERYIADENGIPEHDKDFIKE